MGLGDIKRQYNRNLEEEIIQGSKLNHLYNHEFEKGRFFQVVHEDREGFEVRLSSRTMLKAIYIQEKDDIEGIEIIKLIAGKPTQKVVFSKFNFEQLRTFLKFLDDLDLKGVSEKRIRLAEGDELNEENIKRVKTLLANQGGPEIVEALINEGIITSHDIVNTAFRKRGLKIFRKLLEDKNYWKEYAQDNGISKSKEEPVWQYFFQKNEWIFGYGLDYRFNQVLQREANVSDVDLDGKNTVISDFLMGDQRFTTFVELKKPTTPIFGKDQNRSNAWKLSSDLQNSVSQILEQKASGVIKMEKPQYNDKGEIIQEKTFDSKVILIIGQWNELDKANSTRERDIKMQTFELYRRNSRNVEIITYDELYERARFIVESHERDSLTDLQHLDREENIEEMDDYDDLPF